jgi:hypothetical protein
VIFFDLELLWQFYIWMKNTEAGKAVGLASGLRVYIDILTGLASDGWSAFNAS